MVHKLKMPMGMDEMEDDNLHDHTETTIGEEEDYDYDYDDYGLFRDNNDNNNIINMNDAMDLEIQCNDRAELYLFHEKKNKRTPGYPQGVNSSYSYSSSSSSSRRGRKRIKRSALAQME